MSKSRSSVPEIIESYTRIFNIKYMDTECLLDMSRNLYLKYHRHIANGIQGKDDWVGFE